MTHDELVLRGEKWLRNTEERCLGMPLANGSTCYSSARCSTIVAELVTHASETPDVIGWRDGRSVLLECKTSKSDFRADQKKLFRRIPGAGMGDCRFYLTPPGLLVPQALPGNWGLIEVHGNRVVVLKNAIFQESCAENEKLILCSMIRRLKESASVLGKF